MNLASTWRRAWETVWWLYISHVDVVGSERWKASGIARYTLSQGTVTMYSVASVHFSNLMLAYGKTIRDSILVDIGYEYRLCYQDGFIGICGQNTIRVVLETDKLGCGKGGYHKNGIYYTEEV